MKSTITLTYEELVGALKEAKQAAIDTGSMTEPEGYSELEGKAVAVADDCWLKGMSDLETAILNWAHDELHGLNAPKIVPPAEPTPIEGLCPRDGSPCECAGDGKHCCAEREAFGKPYNVGAIES